MLQKIYCNPTSTPTEMMKVSKMIVPGGDTETPSLLTSCWWEVLTPQHRDAPITRGYVVYTEMGPGKPTSKKIIRPDGTETTRYSRTTYYVMLGRCEEGNRDRDITISCLCVKAGIERNVKECLSHRVLAASKERCHVKFLEGYLNELGLLIGPNKSDSLLNKEERCWVANWNLPSGWKVGLYVCL